MEEPGTQRLTNDDFRKLLSTGSKSGSSSSSAAPAASKTPSKKTSAEKQEARKKKKSFYAQHKKADETSTILSELSEKYRDRAKERREGQNDQSFDPRTSTSGYRAVAAPEMGGLDAAERRRKMIQESKFLGGDIKYTHLVKGLDYALLQKVRSEIVHQEKMQEVEMEKIVEEQLEKQEKMESREEQESDEMQVKTIMGSNILRLITLQKSKTVERNEMFNPGRMAYLVELEDENAETDIPTTIIRSKAETSNYAELNTLNSTHDIVVNKLAQIFSYLRQGGKKKNKKRDKEIFRIPEEKPSSSSTVTKASPSSSSSKPKRNKEEDSIYGDIGDYKPPSYRDKKRYDDDRDDYDHRKSSSSSSSKKKRNYFDKPLEVEEIVAPAPPKLSTQLISKLNAPEIDGYAECYPGLVEMDDAVCDSDEDADYSKMDKGNKKGPIGRWDFETQEEYSEYMSTKEALPKAAFQYGVKMSEGRKTRKNKNENQKLDQEWQKIQKIITKRKGDGSSSSGVDFKKPKH
ncbi:hypothetical protein PVAND_003173 [Polypedilum vanderplanki]|uniref:Protein Red n=1 Tax=Polypedilum vanderplanki TaxID=319348 RepID=A0A9J6BUB3_POLVA|nr:hypothetical protein PVAND_003173 [Polypedilum vanderplanki]